MKKISTMKIIWTRNNRQGFTMFLVVNLVFIFSSLLLLINQNLHSQTEQAILIRDHYQLKTLLSLVQHPRYKNQNFLVTSIGRVDKFQKGKVLIIQGTLNNGRTYQEQLLLDSSKEESSTFPN